MKKYILPLILILLLTFTSVGDCAWLANWDYRIELEIADYAGDIGAAVTWFPVTVFLTATQCEEVFVELTTDAEYNLVAFTKADGTTELYGECELFDVSEKLGIYHVSRDGWTINANTSIYMYYDKDHAPNAFIGAITARTEVWDGNFKLVYHMVDDNGNVDDSTSNNNDGTKEGAGEPAEATGKVGQGQDFDGINDNIACGDMGISESYPFTFEACFKTDGVLDSGAIVGEELLADDEVRVMIFFSNGKLHYNVRNGSDEASMGALELDDSQWHYVAGVSIASNDHEIYSAGNEVDDSSVNVPSPAVDSTKIGRYWRDGADDFYFSGLIDEVRISSTNRSAAWLKGTYNSLWDSLLTYGSEETEEVVTNVIFMFSNF